MTKTVNKDYRAGFLEGLREALALAHDEAAQQVRDWSGEDREFAAMDVADRIRGEIEGLRRKMAKEDETLASGGKSD